MNILSEVGGTSPVSWISIFAFPAMVLITIFLIKLRSKAIGSSRLSENKIDAIQLTLAYVGAIGLAIMTARGLR